MSTRQEKVVKVKRNRDKNLRKRQKGIAGSSVATIPIPAQSQKAIFFKDIVPNRIVSRLKYICNRILSNTGLNTCSIQFRSNGLYDVDPAVASSSVPGFAEWLTLYQRYRVLKCHTKCTFVNREAFPVIINLGFDTQPYTANTKVLAYYEGSNQKTQILGTNAASFGTTIEMSRGPEIVGDNMALNDFGYTGTVASNPSSLWYHSISADASYLGTVFTTLGVAVRWETEFETEFFERKSLFN